MSCNIITTLDFVRELRHLSKRYRSIKDDVAKLGEQLRANPTLGTDLGGGIRKIRLAIGSKGRGKSGGARVITYNIVAKVDGNTVILVTIYDKAEHSSIEKREIVALLKKNGFLS